MLLLVLLSMTAASGFAFAQSHNALFPEPVYVDLQKSGDIEVFPQQKVWHGFPECHYVEVGPKGNLLIISGFKTGQVYFADAHTGKELAILKIGKLVQGVNISPTGRVAVAVNTSDGAADVINLSSFKVTHVIPVGKIPHNVVFSRDGRYAYVSVQGADKIAVIDMHTDKVERDIRAGLYHGAMDDMPSATLPRVRGMVEAVQSPTTPPSAHPLRTPDPAGDLKRYWF